MSAAEAFPAESGQVRTGPSPPGGLMDVLAMAAVVLDGEGRIVLWSPQAEELFGYTADEALGQYAARLMVHEEQFDLVVQLFAKVMAGGEPWAGVFPVRLRNGTTRLVEFRNMRLQDDQGAVYALGLATDQATLRTVERNLALSTRLVSQSPIGLAVLDADLRYVAVNPALARINGLDAESHLGHSLAEVMPGYAVAAESEAAMRQVLATGVPIVDQERVGRTPADPEHDHAWSTSYYRLEDPAGHVLGIAVSVIDTTERHQAAIRADRARRRLALIADASVSVGTTLDLYRTAQELADLCVPRLADIAAVDVLDSLLEGASPSARSGSAVFRALALSADRPGEATDAADQPGQIAAYGPDRLVSQCVRTGRPVLVPRVTPGDLARIARDRHAAALLERGDVRSYLAVPLIARGEVIGALDLKRTGSSEPFDGDDVVLAGELAVRAAISIDNARLYECVRNTAVTLQRGLRPERPPVLAGLEIATRYAPASATSEVGGDWYDLIPLPHDRVALVVGDVMGNGIEAATTMGRLRTATRAFAELDLAPDDVLSHLDKITCRLEHHIATCLYAVYDPRRGECRISNAGHLPPSLVRPGRAAELIEVTTGAPLGVGCVPFLTTTVALAPGDRLVLYTDGLIETRADDIDTRLQVLLTHLDSTDHRSTSLEETCDRLLDALRDPAGHDDVALLVAQVR
jgi:PAS domain S-box-containing protein